jgi:hypothetical protein
VVRFTQACLAKIPQILDGRSALTRLLGQVGAFEGVFEGAGGGGVGGLAAHVDVLGYGDFGLA